ncbi:hypothetical protein F511_04703 [Dorcoceras hygrometricum]|uniref:Uncharacterized protein n=1 Tax=Dorcoceras hygrometricum TaxID=472368 RepID=A0A2Z7B1W1_9LAMI|nr:hypothetical protein F511_04703 [Dorcoceras hygrometricum]
MARSNKYTSVNFNEIFEKKLNNNIKPTANGSFSSSTYAFANHSKNTVANSKIHGHMLVLSRPPPTKPVSSNQNTEIKEKGSSLPATPPSADRPRASPEPERITPITQDQTGVVTLPPSPPLVSPVKSDKFIPPHLRPGFVRKEENFGSEFVVGSGSASFKAKSDYGGSSPGPAHGAGGSGSRSNRYGEEVRPKSGGGYAHVRRGGEPTYLNRSGPSENRPSSSG